MTALVDRLAGRRFGLVLSAGYFGFFGHAGFLRGLVEAGLKPAAWAGTSAGGLIAACAAAGLEQGAIEQLLFGLERKSFWDPDWVGAATDALRSGHRSTGLLSGKRFRGLLEAHLPAQSFAACAAPLLLVACDLSAQSAEVMTQGDLASAIHATCAYPGMFQAVRRDGKLLWDGGLVDKAPALALADQPRAQPLEALLVHYLPSHDVPEEPRGAFAWPKGMVQALAALRKDHFRLQLEVLAARGIEVHVVSSRLPKVGPKALGHGRAAFDAGRASAVAALARAPAPWAPAD